MCAFAKAVASQENAAVVLGLAAIGAFCGGSRLRAIQENFRRHPLANVKVIGGTY
jgi:enoyl-CoA hydratase/carnithine racemase